MRVGKAALAGVPEGSVGEVLERTRALRQSGGDRLICGLAPLARLSSKTTHKQPKRRQCVGFKTHSRIAS